MNLDDIEEWTRIFYWKKPEFIAEQYHEMIKQMPKEIQDHIKECTPCRRLSQLTVTNVFELINRQLLTLYKHVKKDENQNLLKMRPRT